MSFEYSHEIGLPEIQQASPLLRAEVLDEINREVNGTQSSLSPKVLYPDAESWKTAVEEAKRQRAPRPLGHLVPSEQAHQELLAIMEKVDRDQSAARKAAAFVRFAAALDDTDMPVRVDDLRLL